ncbi:MAG: hypothetical protein KDK78_02325 [Chlamydiia bacterium]|nr:hypothetical protein [Chlamydiia bacterium]
MSLLLVLLLVALLGAIIGAYTFTQLSRWKTRRHVRQRFEKGQAAESCASSVLAAHGYELLDEQRSIELTCFVDGAPRRYLVRPDGLAQRGEAVYLVEIKSGARAPNPLAKDTRRQLLEYYYGSGAIGVLLVNAETETVHEISFGEAKAFEAAPKAPEPVAPPPLPTPRRPYGVFACGILIGILLGISIR